VTERARARPTQIGAKKILRVRRATNRSRRVVFPPDFHLTRRVPAIASGSPPCPPAPVFPAADIAANPSQRFVAHVAFRKPNRP